MKRILIVFSLLISTLSGYAQRLYKGAEQLSISYVEPLHKGYPLFSPDSYGAELSYVRTMKRQNLLFLSAGYRHENVGYKGAVKQGTIPLDMLLFNAGIEKKLINVHDYLLFYLGGGVTLGYEEVNGGKKELKTGEQVMASSHFIYGVLIRGGIDLYFHDSIALTSRYEAPLFFGSKVALVRPSFSVGVKIKY